MRLSAPIFRLKRQAKLLSRKENIPLSMALDRLAKVEGFSSWSLLAARMSSEQPVRKLFAELEAGDMVLLGARPGHGKTLMGLALIVEAMKQGRKAFFFSLEYTQNDVLDRFRSIGADPASFKGKFEFDDFDGINADYMIDRLRGVARGTVVVVDYLQLLDQKRENPELGVQIAALKSFAETEGIILILISQIDRSFELSGKLVPEITDVRLPNPLDLGLFDKSCFLNDGEIRFEG